MEVDAEDDDDDDWSEVSSRDTSAATRPSAAAVAASPTQPRDVAPIDHMEVGNPWDSANAIASSPTHETSFDVAFNSPPPPAPKSKVIEQPDIPHFGDTDSASGISVIYTALLKASLKNIYRRRRHSATPRPLFCYSKILPV